MALDGKAIDQPQHAKLGLQFRERRRRISFGGREENDWLFALMIQLRRDILRIRRYATWNNFRSIHP